MSSPSRVGRRPARTRPSPRAAGIVFKDTDLVSTVVYAHHYYGACPRVGRARGASNGSAISTCSCIPDVPWVEDGLQRDRPAGRAILHGLFIERLSALGARVVDVTGDWSTRRPLAFQAVTALLAHRGQTQV